MDLFDRRGMALRCLLFAGIIFSSSGAKVQLFKNADFKGEMLELNSSATCTSLPTTFQNLQGSIKTTGCVVIYRNNSCSQEGRYWVYGGIDGDGYVVRSEETRLGELHHKYLQTKRQDFNVNSIKDCTDMENKPTVNFDYYEEKYFVGKIIQLKDICSCINLPKSSFKNIDRAANTYGNCFKIYKKKDCVGEPYYTASVIWNSIFFDVFVSIQPCDAPPHCRTRYTASNLTFVPLSVVSKITSTIQQEEAAFTINNGSTTLEQNYESVMKTNEIAQNQVPNEFTQFASINVFGSDDIEWTTGSLFHENASETLKSAIVTAFQGLQSNWSETALNGVQTKKEFQVYEKLSILPCSQYELKQLVEMTEVEIQYRVQFSLSGDEKKSGAQVKAKVIRSDFKAFNYLNSTEEFAVFAETTMKLKLKYGTKTWVNVSKDPIVECRRQCIKLAATVNNLQPLQNVQDMEGSTKRHAITTKQIILNNGTIKQEDNYEAARKMRETAQFQFPDEMSQIISLNFTNGLNPFNEISNPFITDAWIEIKAGLSGAFRNFSDSEDANMFEVERENEYRVQRKISVPPCSKYEINSFVEMVENLEINYVIQLEITGKLELEPVRAEEIREILQNMTVLRNKDDFTVVAESTAKLTMTYGVSSGVDASGSPILDCRSRFIKFDASIVNLEVLTTVSNSSLPQAIHPVPVAPRLVFINNSTTQHEELYEATKDITEMASFEFSKEFYQISSIKVEEDVKNILENSIPFLENVWINLKSGLFAKRSSWNESISFGVRNTKEIRVNKGIVQAPCMRYEVSSFLEVKENVEISYRVLLEVTAELGSERVRAKEIRSNLKQLSFLNDKDDFTAVVETTMKLKLNYGHGSGVDVAGTQMLDCMEIQAALIANCKFTCSG